MGFSYLKLWEFMKKKGITSTYFKKNPILNQQTLHNMRQGQSISLASIENVCKHFYRDFDKPGVRISDFVTWVPEPDFLYNEMLLEVKRDNPDISETECQQRALRETGFLRYICFSGACNSLFPNLPDIDSLDSFYQKVAYLTIPEMESLIAQIQLLNDGKIQELDFDNLHRVKMTAKKTECAQAVQRVKPGLSQALQTILDGIKDTDGTTEKGRKALKKLIDKGHAILNELESNLTDK